MMFLVGSRRERSPNEKNIANKTCGAKNHFQVLLHPGLAGESIGPPKKVVTGGVTGQVPKVFLIFLLAGSFF